MEPCPPEDALTALAAGGLPAGESERLHRHVRGCEGCRLALAAMADSLGGVQTSGPGVPRSDLLEAGQMLGAYRIEGLIGRGGMGEVYRAHDDRLARSVAIKVLPARSGPSARAQVKGTPGPTTPAVQAESEQLQAHQAELVRRFDSEALLTARVQHPAVVPIYERGQLPDGRLFYAMKLVSGRSLRQLIAERPSLPERIALLPNLIAVAEALAHAHGQRIVHRDVKPDNIVIGELGETVLIDWGLAKNLSDAPEPPRLQAQPIEADRTAAGAIIGTPAFMSPEQAEGAPVDERADVFSLGATLYCLLTTRPPYGGERPLLDAARGTFAPLESLQQEVPAELTAIVRRAMEPDAPRRYPTARELAEDLRRFQTGQLVLSHRYSTRELLGRWSRRHRSLLVASAVFLVVAAAGATISVRRIVAEADRATSEAEGSRRVSEFMTRMFRVSDPSEARGNSVTAREILDKAARQIETGLSKDPAVQARLLETMAQVYNGLGLFTKARPAIEKAIELRTKLLGPEHPDTLHSMVELGLTLEQQGKLAEAEAQQQKVLDIRARVQGPEHPQTLLSMNNVATVKMNLGKYAEAAALHRRVLAVRRRVLGPDHAETLRSMINLAGAEYGQGHYQAARDAAAEVLAAQRRTLGADHPVTLSSLHNLATVERDLGRPAESEKLFREALEVKKRVFGPEHRDVLISMTELGLTLSAQRQYAQAEALLREARDLCQKALGPEHPATLRALTSLAAAESSLGREADAEKDYRHALELQRKVLGDEHPYRLEAQMNLGNVLARQGRLGESEQVQQGALATARRVLGPRHPLVGQSLYYLGSLSLRQGDRPRSLSLLRQAVDSGLGPSGLLELRADDDLKALRGDPAFKALFKPAAEAG